MKYDKTKEDVQQEGFDLNNDPILVYLKHQEQHQFSVGDVLIKLYPSGEEWKHEVASSTADVPKKFLYAFENELGIGYVKPFKTNGKISDKAYCMTTFDPRYVKFVLDPEYADHIILSEGEEFKPVNSFKERKKFRDKAIANNKKLLLPNDAPSVLAWMSELKVGDTFHLGYNTPHMCEQKYKVTALVDDVVTKLANSYDADQYINKLGIRRTDVMRMIKVEVVKHKWQNVGHAQVLNPLDFLNRSFTTKDIYPLAEDK